MQTNASFTLATPPLQATVDRFVGALGGPRKLLGVHPRKKGNSGNFAALNPAIVLGCISAFEGFAEEFIAVGLAKRKATFGQISKEIGNWNNPDIRDFANRAAALFGPGGASILGGLINVNVNTVTGHSTWAERPIDWGTALDHSASWMQVRHALTHGLVPTWSDVQWPPPIRRSPNTQPATLVLRQTKSGRHSLVLQNAMNCARIYTIGAKYIATEAATWLSETLDWSRLPEFK